MKTKCNNCKKFNKVGFGSPGRNTGYCEHFKYEKLPYFVSKNQIVRQNQGEDCETFEQREIIDNVAKTLTQ